MRLKREARTIASMIGLYCEGHGHEDGPTCASCAELRDYALKRVAACRFGAEKPVCAKCPVHCYKPEMRERVREVMRWAGPRMLGRHPYLAVMHLWDSARRRVSA